MTVGPSRGRVSWPGWAMLAVWALMGTGEPVLAGCDPATFPIVVDAGHGPRRPGAESARGAPEYVFNTRLAARVVAALAAAGFSRARLLDPEGLDLTPVARAARANAARARLLVSIHHDSVQPRYLASWTVADRPRRYGDQFAGYSLFYSGKSAFARESLELARLTGRELRAAGLTFSRHHVERIPGESRELVDDTVGVYRYDGLAVLREAAMPAVLVEAGVIVNRAEEEALAEPGRIERTAGAIARGVLAYCREEKP